MDTVKLVRKARVGGKNEAEVQASIRLAVGSLPDVRVMRNNTGALPSKSGRLVEFGLAVGSSDLVCIVSPAGRWLVIEVKEEDWKPARPTNKRRWEHEEDQRKWMAIVERFGGVAGFATSVDEAMVLVERARSGS